MESSFKRITLFLLPYLLIMACFCYLLISSGEFTKTEDIAKRMIQHQPIIFHNAFTNRDYDFKLQSTKLLRPEVLILGSSRMAGLRGSMFQPYKFYNGSACIYDVRDYEKFLTNLGAPYPKVIILAIDWYHLGPGFSPNIPVYTPWERKKESINGISKAIYASFIKEPIAIIQTLTRFDDPIRGVEAIGLNARKYGVGFQNDGSWQFGNHLLDKYRDLDSDGYIQFIRQGINFWGEYDEYDKEKLMQLESLSNFAKSKGIKLYSISMPLDPIIVEAFNLSPKMKAWRNFQLHGVQVLSQFGVTHFNFNQIDKIEGNKDEFFDSVHPSDPANARVLIKMLENPNFAKSLPMLDKEKLKINLKSASRLEVYSDNQN